MDTEMELACDAATPETVLRYGCSVVGCSSAQVDDIGDLKRCEKCDCAVCDGHAIERLSYALCPTCDRSEKIRLEVLLPHLDALIDRVRDHKVSAEEAEGKLAALALEAAEIEGRK